MKLCKKLLAIMCVVTVLFSTFSICAQAAAVTITEDDYGYMMLTDRKLTKKVSSTKLYGNYDYLNFIIKCYESDAYFFYELYSDSKCKNLVASDGVYCGARGTFSYSSYLNLKSLKTKTYYLVTYSATVNDFGDITVSAPSMSQYKVSVYRSASYKNKTVILKSVTNTVNGPKITWHKLSNDTSKYIIYRRSLTGTKWTNLGTVKGSTLTFTDKKIKNSTGKYVYTVRGANKKGTKSNYQYNGLISLYTKAPTVKSVATTYDNQIKVTWNNTYKSAKYNVYRKENNGGWKLIKKEHNSTTFYDNTAKVNGKNYRYTVRGVVNTKHGKAISSFYNGSALDFIEAPVLNIVEQTDNMIKFAWNPVAGAEYYSVYRREITTDKWSNIGKLSKNTLEYSENVPKDKAYDYSIRAEGKKYRGSYSNTGVRHFILQAPAVTVTPNLNSISVKWTSVPYAEKYEVLRMGGNGQWIKLETRTDNSTTIHPDRYSTYELSVRAVRGSQKSDAVRTQEIEYFPPINISYTVYSDRIAMTWNHTYASEYNVYRKVNTNPEAEYELIGTVNSAAFDDASAEYDVQYKYYITGVYNGKEQTNKIVEKIITKYSSDKYIKDFTAVASVMNPRFNAHRECYHDNPVTSYEFNTELTAAGNGFKTKYYVQNQDGTWVYKTQYNSFYYEDEPTVQRFACSVYDSYGATPIDCIYEEVDTISIPYVKLDIVPVAEGLKLSWQAVEGAISYEIKDVSKKVNKVITENGSSEYSVIIPKSSFDAVHTTTYQLKASFENKCETKDYVWDYTYRKVPVTVTSSLDNGKVYLHWNGDRNWGEEYVVFRKEKGSSTWEKLRVGGDGNYIDRSVEKGKTYSYAVRTYDSTKHYYTSYFNTTTITVK